MGIRFFHKILFPDASVLSERWVSRSPESIAGASPDGKFSIEVEDGGVVLTFKGVADAGLVICSLWQADRMLTHSAVVPGVVQADDAAVLTPYVDSLVKSPVVQELTGGATGPFGDLLHCSERPLCVTVLIPADARQVNDAAIRWQERWVASYLPQVLEYVQ